MEFAADDYEERDADIFKAGNYPAKNFKATPADITKLAEANVPVPIYFHHVKGTGKLKLGEVTSFYADGDWLKGKMSLLRTAVAFLDDVGVKTVSASIAKDFSRVLEVSVTDDPAVIGAQYFANDSAEVVSFTLGSTPEKEKDTMPDVTPEAVTAEQFSAVSSELEKQKQVNAELAKAVSSQQATVAALEFSMRKERAKATIAGYGEKLPPAAQPYAQALLLTGGVIAFSAKEGEAEVETTVPDLVRGLLDNLPVHFGKGINGHSTEAAKTDEAQVLEFMKMGMSKEGAEEAVKLSKEAN